jgi:diguanylate cyclase (GGDEF)-like protein
MANLVPVNHNPFEIKTSTTKLTPVDYNPFEQAPQENEIPDRNANFKMPESSFMSDAADFTKMVAQKGVDAVRGAYDYSKAAPKQLYYGATEDAVKSLAGAGEANREIIRQTEGRKSGLGGGLQEARPDGLTDEQWAKWQATNPTGNFDLYDWRVSQAEQGQQAMENIASKMPTHEPPKNLLEEAARGAGVFAPTMGLGMVAPQLALPMAYEQIFGLKYKNYVDDGVDKNRALDGARMVAAISAPIESFGTLIERTQLLKLAGGLLKKSGAGNRALMFLRRALSTAATEGLEEYFQAYPEELGDIYAKNPDATGKEIRDMFMESVKSTDFQKRAGRSAAAGTIGGTMMAGIAGGVGGIGAGIEKIKGKGDAGNEKLEIAKFRNQFQKAIDKGDQKKVNKIVGNFLNNENVSPEIRRQFAETISPNSVRGATETPPPTSPSPVVPAPTSSGTAGGVKPDDAVQPQPETEMVPPESDTVAMDESTQAIDRVAQLQADNQEAINKMPVDDQGVILGRTGKDRRKGPRRDAEQLDNLTGIPNSNYIRPKIDEAKKDTTKEIFFFDIDNFKAVNDVLGHDVGDIALEGMGRLLEKHFDDAEFGRYGGEEFTVILDKSPENEKRIKAFADDVAQNITVNDEPVTISGGVASGEAVDERGKTRLKADMFAYDAKKSGRNKIKLDKGGEQEYYLSGPNVGEKNYVRHFDIQQLEATAGRLSESSLASAPGVRDALAGAVQAVKRASSGEIQRDTDSVTPQKAPEVADQPSEPVTPRQAHLATLKPYKRQSTQAYYDYVDSLTDKQRDTVSDLITDTPKSPKMDLAGLRAALKKRTAKAKLAPKKALEPTVVPESKQPTPKAEQKAEGKEPVVKAYHGSPEKITLDDLDIEKTGRNIGGKSQAKGIYFSNKKDDAKSYAEYSKIAKGESGSPTVLEAEIDTSNLKQIETNEIITESQAKPIRDAGYDGIWKKGIGGSSGFYEFILFNKNPIKERKMSSLVDLFVDYVSEKNNEEIDAAKKAKDFEKIKKLSRKASAIVKMGRLSTYREDAIKEQIKKQLPVWIQKEFDAFLLDRNEKQDDNISDVTEQKNVTEAKEPWEMTRDEYKQSLIDDIKTKIRAVEEKNTRDVSEQRGQQLVRQRNKLDRKLSRITNEEEDVTGKDGKQYIVPTDKIDKNHKKAIRKAISEGKFIPKEVLKDYPDLIPEGMELMDKPGDKAKKGSAEAKPDIQDFGEVLHGARKHYAEKLSDAEKLDTVSAPLSKTWPEPDYDNLIDGGVKPEIVAIVRVMRDSVPPKGRTGWKVRQYVDAVESLRGLAQRLLTGDLSYEKYLEVLDKPEFKNLKKTLLDNAELYLQVGHKHSLKGIRLTAGSYSMYKGVEYRPSKTIWTVEKRAKATAFSNWPTVLSEGDTKEEAISEFKKKIDKNPASVGKKRGAVKFDIYRIRGDKKIYIGKRYAANRYVDLESFDTIKEAREYLANNQDALEEKLAKAKNFPKARKDENSPRVGIDHLEGQDATPEMFTDAFGFRGVQFGNYVEQGKRQEDLNEAYNALMDMAGVLGIPAKAISLNGKLGLAFGARGVGGKDAPAAHYEPDAVVINLTKKRGAGSLAHEWWHALDNYFDKQRNAGGYITEKPYKIKDDDGTRQEMIDAFNGVMEAIKNTKLIERSRRQDRTKSKPYWATVPELSARSFENYIIEKLHDQNGSNDYLANIVSQKVWDVAASMGFEQENSYPYLTEEEIPSVKAAFQNLFDVIESKETDKGVALYEESPTVTDFSGISLAQLKKLPFMKGKSVEINEDGSVAVKFAPGKVLTIKGLTDTGGKVRADLGTSPTGATRTAQYQNHEVIFTKASDLETVFHEIGSHFFEDIGLINKGDKMVLNEAVRRATGKRPGMETREGWEARARWIGANLANREQYRGTKLGRVLQKVADFIDSLVGLVKLTERGVLRKIEKGDVKGEKPVKSAMRFAPAYELTDSGKSGKNSAMSKRSGKGDITTETTPEPGGDSAYKRKIIGSLLAEAKKHKTAEGFIKSLEESGRVVYHATYNDFAEFRHNEIGIHFGTMRQAEKILSLRESGGRTPKFFEIVLPDNLNFIKAKDLGSWNNMPDVVSSLKLREILGDSYFNKLKEKRLNYKRKLMGEYGFDNSGRKTWSYFDISKENMEKFDSLLYEWDIKEFNAIRRLLIKKGFDGIQYWNAHEGIGESYSIFLPNDFIDKEKLLAAINESVISLPNPSRQTEESGTEPLNETKRNTATAAFKKWFGKSKVVDEGGEPLVVYHGTDKYFTKFKTHEGAGGELGAGAYFTNNPETAGVYGEEAESEDYRSGARILPVYLSLQNPLDVSNLDYIPSRKKLIKQGYDGIIEKVGDKMQIVAFYPTQIKSIFNRGTWDGNNKDILYEEKTNPADELKKLGAMYKEKFGPDDPVMKKIIAESSPKILKGILGREQDFKLPKPDITLADRMLNLMSHYSAKVPGLKLMYEAGLGWVDDKNTNANELFHGKNKDGETISYIENLKRLSKKDKMSYKRLQAYLLNRDRDAVGYRVRKDEESKKFQLFDLKGKKVAEFDNDVAAWNEAIEREVADAKVAGFNDAMVEGLVSFRSISHNIFNMRYEAIKDLIEKYEKEGRKPSIAYKDELGNSVKIDLKVALAEMGDLRGHYFPRTRNQGKWIIRATKNGAQPILEMRDTKATASLRRMALEKQGYTVAPITMSERMPESVFALAGQNIAINELVDKALEGVDSPRTKTLKDIGITLEKDGDDVILKGIIEKDKSREIVEAYGGKYEEFFQRGHKSYKYDGRYRFKGADAKELENKLTKALFLQKGIDSADIELLFAAEFAEQLANTIKERGARSAMIHRQRLTGKDVWAGYEEDPLTAIARAGQSTASAQAKKYMAIKMINAMKGTTESWAEWRDRMKKEGYQTTDGKRHYGEAYINYDNYLDHVEEQKISATKQKNAFESATKYMQDMLRNEEAIDRVMGTIKGVAVLKYLGFRLAAPAVNMTALVTNVPATMNGYADIPLHRAPDLLAKAVTKYGAWKVNPGSVSEDTQKALKRIYDKGWHKAQFNMEAVNVLKGKFGRGYGRLIDASMAMFGVTEQINRVATILGAYDGIKKTRPELSFEKQMELAKEVSDKAHGTYGKPNYPELARGSGIGGQVLKSAYVFKTFTHNYLATLKELGWDKKNIKAASWLIASPALLAGTTASMVTPAMMKMVNLALKLWDKDEDDPEEALYRWMYENAGENAGKFTEQGLFGLLGLDLKGSLQVNVTDIPTDLFEILGAPGSMIKDIGYGIGDLSQGELDRAFERLLPNAFAAPIKAYRERTEGVTTHRNTPVYWGNEPLKSSALDAWLRALSFNPAELSSKKGQLWREKNIEKEYQERRSKINERIKDFVLKPQNKKTKKEWADIMTDVYEYNQRLKRNNMLGILNPITSKSIDTYIKRTFKPSKRDIARRLKAS